jgi:4-diphosphocytidyl-2C-methyl-D-erythritol kinase
LVEGVGERLTPLRFESRDVTLLMPDFAVSTASCYRAFDHLAMNGDVARGRNHLEVAAGIVEPRLASTLGWLRSELGDEVTLCGSGSTMFIEGHVEKGLERWDVQGPDGTVRFCQTTTTPS